MLCWDDIVEHTTFSPRPTSTYCEMVPVRACLFYQSEIGPGKAGNVHMCQYQHWCLSQATNIYSNVTTGKEALRSLAESSKHVVAGAGAPGVCVCSGC